MNGGMNDLALEYSVVQALRSAIAAYQDARDFVSRGILVKMLDDTERDRAYWREKPLGVTKLKGRENYLQSLTGGSGTS